MSFSRKDYLDGKCTHDQYYEQLVKGSNAKSIVLSRFTIEELKEMYEHDEDFNWIPESMKNKYVRSSIEIWDRMAKYLTVGTWKEFGDNCTLSGQVCVLKCAAKMLVKEAEL